MKVLLGQSDPDELDITAYALHRHGYRVLTALDGKSIVAKWQSENPDLIILETGLSKISGLEVCRQIREESQIPIIFLSERSGDQDVVAAFNVGGDDYVVKPFSARQLAARVQAALRRLVTSRARADGLDNNIAVGSLQIDAEEHKVNVGDRQVHLTPLEFRLLYCLAANKGHVISTEQLIEYAWGLRDGGDASVLKTHISRIRQKLDEAIPTGGAIKNVPGIGYCLDD